jgi:hypothetical protein
MNSLTPSRVRPDSSRPPLASASGTDDPPVTGSVAGAEVVVAISVGLTDSDGDGLTDSDSDGVADMVDLDGDGDTDFDEQLGFGCDVPSSLPSLLSLLQFSSPTRV